MPFFKHAEIKYSWLVALYVLKVMAGVAYGWLYSMPEYIETSDTWNFYKLSLGETDLLLNNPVAFVTGLFKHGYETSGSLFQGENSYWNNLKTNLIIKLIACFNVFTARNYYVNVLFFNFFFMFGPVAVFRLLRQHYKGNKIVMLAAVFCIPSFLFWYSGAHKDGLIFSIFGLLLYQLNRLFLGFRHLSTWVQVCIYIVLLFGFRNYYVLLLLPAAVVWFGMLKWKVAWWKMVAVVYTICVALFWSTALFLQDFGLPGYVIAKQSEFRNLGGGSQLPHPALEPTLQSFINYLPYALDIAILRPHINEIENKSYWPAIIENVLVLGLFIYLLWKILQSKQTKYLHYNTLAYIVFLYCFSISLLVFTGYIVTLTGAIVRYKAFVLPLIIAPLMIYLPPTKHIR